LTRGGSPWSFQSRGFSGLPPGELGGDYQSFMRRVHPDDRDRVQGLVVLARAKGGVHELEFRVIWPDGGVHRMLAKGRSFVGADGNPTRMILALRDVTERRRSEQEREELMLKLTAERDALSRTEKAFRRQREDQRMILDAVPAMIWFKDKDNNILDCNEAAAASVGMLPRDLNGRSTYEVFPEQAKKFHDDDLEVIASGKPKLGIVEALMTERGETRWVQTDKVPYYGEDGKTTGVVVFCLDVTQRQRAEEVLRESERSQRDFVANVSHELRTPVAAIKGFAETLRRGGLEDGKNRLRFVKIIESHAERLGMLIENLLFMSAVDSGKVKLSCEPVSLSALLSDYIGSIESLTRRKRLSVSVSVEEDCVAFADKLHLLQVVENIFANAIKYGKPEGRIVATARGSGDAVVLSIGDDGIGIPKADLPRIFDRFFRVEKGASPGNSGLGLYIAKRLVEAHSGRLWAESELGRGSTFHVELPAAGGVKKDRRA